MTTNLREVASGLGLPFGDRKMVYNSRMAQEAGKWAEAAGKGEQFHNAIFRAYLVDGRNIGALPVIAEVAESVGLSGSQARRVLEEGAYTKAVDLDWERSRELKINAAPTFLFDRRVLVGAQPYEALKKFLLSA